MLTKIICHDNILRQSCERQKNKKILRFVVVFDII